MFSPYEFSFFERLFEMESGYVLDFSNGTFNNFIRDSVGIDVYDEDYLKKFEKSQGSSSKAKILRYFWRNESNEHVFKLVNDLVEYYEIVYFDCDKDLLKKAKSILNNYSNHVIVNDEISSEERVIDLIKEINKTIAEGQPIFALDRLHTLLHNILRNLCYAHNIPFEKFDGINQLMKYYVNFLKENSYIESQMSETIFRQLPSLLSIFNNVRNNKTYAHDNEILSYNESMLIYKQVVNILEFISAIYDNFELY
ncbi:abortive infection family protein [Methanobrevibacter sp.]